MGQGSDEVLLDLLGLQEKLYKLFDDALGGGARPATGPGRWAPPVDIHDAGDAYVLCAELPGMGRDAIGLEMDHGVLILRGERPTYTPQPGASYHRMERPNGSFHRVFRLPQDADPDAVTACCRDGVLEVRVPKHGVDAVQSVPIQVE